MAQPDNAPVLTVDQDILHGQDSVNANPMQTTIAELLNFLRTYFGVVNLEGPMEEGGSALARIDQDVLTVTTEPMYSDLIPLGDQDSVNANPMQTTIAELINLLRTNGVNIVGGMEEGVGVLANVDQDIFTVTSENMNSDLIPLDDQNMTTLIPVAVSQSLETPNSWMLTPAPSTKSEDSETNLYSLSASAMISPAMTPAYEMYWPMSAAPSTSEETAPSTSEETPPSTSEETAPSTSSDESITLVVSPEGVFGEQLRSKRKRERQPKSETETCAPPRAKKARKTKLYEIDQPFEDKERERKRLNAVNAKKHRVLQKHNKETTEKEIDHVKNERDDLKKEVETLREKEVSLTQQLEVFKKHFGEQALSVVTLLQAGQI